MSVRACASDALARADEPVPLVLSWSAPEGCPSRDEVVDQVLQRLARPPVGPPLIVNAQVNQASTGRFVVRITTQGAASGERVIAGGSCASVTRATVLLLALTIAPGDVRLDPVEPIPSASSSNAAIPSASPPESRFVPTPRRGVSFVPSIGLVAATGISPDVSVGPGFSLGARTERFRVDAVFSGAVAHETSLAGSSARVSWSSLSFGARGCAGVGSVLWVGLCAGLSTSRVLASSSGVLHPADAGAWLTSVSPSGLLSIRVTPAISLEIQAGPSWATSRPRFVIDGVGEAFRPPSVALSSYSAVAWRF